MPATKQEERARPQWFVVKAVGLAIILGTLALMLPWSTRATGLPDPLTAVFTAASAVCVTGHSAVCVPEYYTVFGQTVLLLLIQIGGMGFMLLGTLLLSMAGRHMSMQSEMAVMDVLRLQEAHNLRELLRRSIQFTFCLEACGAALLAWRFHTAYAQPLPQAIFNGVFHSVSAYCNAGFSLFPDSLTAFRHDPAILTVIGALVTAGGLGFIVLYDISRYRFWRHNLRRRGRLMLHTKIVLLATAVLLSVGALAIGALEWRNTLAGLPWPVKILDSLFHAVTARTAGFNTLEMAELRPATRFVNLILMYIGGGPGSTAGGMKVTTLAVLLAATIAMIRGRRETTILNRTLSQRNTATALAVFILSTLLLTGLYGLLLISEHGLLQAGVFSTDFLMFDTVSAFSTTGLSTGIIPKLSQTGLVLMTLCMFIGRVGPLTIAMLVGTKSPRRLVRPPDEDVLVG